MCKLRTRLTMRVASHECLYMHTSHRYRTTPVDTRQTGASSDVKPGSNGPSGQGSTIESVLSHRCAPHPKSCTAYGLGVRFLIPVVSAVKPLSSPKGLHYLGVNPLGERSEGEPHGG